MPDHPPTSPTTLAAYRDICIFEDNYVLNRLEEYRHKLYTRRQIAAGPHPQIGTPCWIWTGWTNEKGRGRIKVFNRQIPVTRVSYIVHKGPTEDKHSLHICDNPSCFNPDHLFLGTDQMNNEDRILKGRNHPKYSPKLLPEDAATIKSRYEAFRISLIFYSTEDRRLAAFKKQLAREYSVHYTTIRDIINGRYHTN